MSSGVPTLLATGFGELNDLSCFFRGGNLRKGRLLLEADHVYDVKELLHDGGSEITAKCIPQTRINAPARSVKIDVSCPNINCIV